MAPDIPASQFNLESFNREARSIIAALYGAGSTQFKHLAAAAGLELSALRGRDWSGIDFCGDDLAELNFTACDLRGAVFDRADVRGCDFRGALLDRGALDRALNRDTAILSRTFGDFRESAGNVARPINFCFLGCGRLAAQVFETLKTVAPPSSNVSCALFNGGRPRFVQINTTATLTTNRADLASDLVHAANVLVVISDWQSRRDCEVIADLIAEARGAFVMTILNNAEPRMESDPEKMREEKAKLFGFRLASTLYSELLRGDDQSTMAKVTTFLVHLVEALADPGPHKPSFEALHSMTVGVLDGRRSLTTFGTGFGTGRLRAIDAAKGSVDLDTQPDIYNAREWARIILISGGKDVSLGEVEDAVAAVANVCARTNAATEVIGSCLRHVGGGLKVSTIRFFSEMEV